MFPDQDKEQNPSLNEMETLDMQYDYFKNPQLHNYKNDDDQVNIFDNTFMGNINDKLSSQNNDLQHISGNNDC